MTIDDYKGRCGQWIVKTRIGGKPVHTLSGMRWLGIKVRCSRYHQAGHAAYLGASNDFADFQQFAEWSRSEQGYDELDSKGKKFALDKDILGGNGKVYCPDSCIFVPRVVNNFLPNIGERVGAHPLGVCVNPVNQLFQAQCRDPISGKVNLGYYLDALEAHAAWQRRKIAVIEILMSQMKWHAKLTRGLERIHAAIYEDFMSGRETKQAR